MFYTCMNSTIVGQFGSSKMMSCKAERGGEKERRREGEKGEREGMEVKGRTREVEGAVQPQPVVPRERLGHACEQGH